jgi:hypothetical protein
MFPASITMVISAFKGLICAHVIVQKIINKTLVQFDYDEWWDWAGIAEKPGQWKQR